VSWGPFFPLVDWFASHDNHQLPRYFSWQADPSAEGVDAFSFCLGNEPGFIFPPFTLIPRILRKVNEDRASVILLHPDWPGALWAPDLHRMIVHQEFLPQSADLLWYPHQPGLRHPMKDLKLVASWLVGASMM
jgi:hypothetical protein